MHRSLRVLLVDDDPVTLAYLRGVLARCGCVVTSAIDVASARRAMAAAAFDLALCDLRLPDAAGATLVARGATVFVAMSAHIDAVAARRLRRQGFAAAIEKPVTDRAFRALIDRHFGALDAMVEREDSSIGEPSTRLERLDERLADPAEPGYQPRRSRTLDPPALDDTAARLACGNDDIVTALRRLLADELRRTRVHIRQAVRTGRFADAREALHKLAASCALVGAQRLRIATIGLMRGIDEGRPERRLSLAFDREAGRTLVALDLSAARPGARTDATR